MYIHTTSIKVHCGRKLPIQFSYMQWVFYGSERTQFSRNPKRRGMLFWSDKSPLWLIQETWLFCYVIKCIILFGVTWQNPFRNNSIKNCTKLPDTMKTNRKWKWTGHIARMKPN